MLQWIIKRRITVEAELNILKRLNNRLHGKSLKSLIDEAISLVKENIELFININSLHFALIKRKNIDDLLWNLIKLLKNVEKISYSIDYGSRNFATDPICIYFAVDKLKSLKYSVKYMNDYYYYSGLEFISSPFLEELDIMTSQQDLFDDFLKAAPKLRNLKVLSIAPTPDSYLDCFKPIYNGGFLSNFIAHGRQLARSISFINLQELKAIFGMCFLLSFLAPNITNIEYVKMTEEPWVDPCDFTALEKLPDRYESSIAELEAHQQISRNLCDLRSVSIKEIRSHNQNYSAIIAHYRRKHPNLESFSIYMNPFPHEVTLCTRDVLMSEKLLSLSLICQSECCAIHAKINIPIDFYLHFPVIQRIDINDAEEDAIDIFLSCPHLQYLRVEVPEKICLSPQIDCKISKKIEANNLNYLELIKYHSIPISFLEMLLTSCPKL